MIMSKVKIDALRVLTKSNLFCKHGAVSEGLPYFQKYKSKEG